MTIGQKIIFSSTFVAFLAAISAYMGWRNTQPIQNKLVENLTHTTEEIRFLDDIKTNITGVKTDILELVKQLNNTDSILFEAHSKKIKLIDIRIKTLDIQINSFAQFNHSADTDQLIEQMLHHSRSIRSHIQLFFELDKGPLDRNMILAAGINSKRVADEFEAVLLEGKQQRFSIIKEEGKNVKERISHLNFWIILFGGLTFLFAIVFGRVIASNLSTSLQKLRQAATQLNKGDYSARVGLKSKDEFGKLGQVFDGMAANLEQSKIIEEQKTEMERLNEALKTKNDALDKFVYRVSHDLKAPVVNIQSLLKLIQSKISSHQDKDVIQSFFFLEKSSNKLHQTIFDLLEVSRIEQSLESSQEWVNIEQALSTYEAENKEDLLANQVKINHDFSIKEIYFSTINLASILSNLISNSIKYRSEDRLPEIHLTTKRAGDFVCLQIIDNGVGIDLEQHGNKLFNMFSRFHNHVEGSGVGLYIVKKIVEEAGGRIDVESQSGSGTIFSIYFDQKNVPVVVDTASI